MARARSSHFSSSQIINIIFFLESLYLSARARSVRRARLGAIHRRPQQIGAAPLANSIILFSLSLSPSLSVCASLCADRTTGRLLVCARLMARQEGLERRSVAASQPVSRQSSEAGARFVAGRRDMIARGSSQRPNRRNVRRGAQNGVKNGAQLDLEEAGNGQTK